jgi:hypothetical protein
MQDAAVKVFGGAMQADATARFQTLRQSRVERPSVFGDEHLVAISFQRSENEMGFKASQNPYFVKTGNDPLVVSWSEDDDPVEIWERFSKQSPPKFKKRVLTDDERERRKIKVPIKKGEVYTAAMYERDSDHPDPNQNLTDPPPNDLLTVVGVVDEHKDLISLPDGMFVGGTYIGTFVSTPAEAYVLLQVGTPTPVVIPTPTTSGVTLKQIVTPDAEAESSGTTGHKLECTPLVPGEKYSYVIMAVDEDGFWDCWSDALNCKWRRVDVTFKSIHVVNDGDSETVGEAKFWATVFESGSVVQETAVRTFELGHDEYEINNGQDINLPSTWKVSIGPKKIETKVDAVVSVQTNAHEYDGIKGEDKAASGMRRLDFPVGRNREETEDTLTLRANPTEGYLEYRLTVDWKVSYSPAPP